MQGKVGQYKQLIAYVCSSPQLLGKINENKTVYLRNDKVGTAFKQQIYGSFCAICKVPSMAQSPS